MYLFEAAVSGLDKDAAPVATVRASAMPRALGASLLRRAWDGIDWGLLLALRPAGSGCGRAVVQQLVGLSHLSGYRRGGHGHRCLGGIRGASTGPVAHRSGGPGWRSAGAEHGCSIVPITPTLGWAIPASSAGRASGRRWATISHPWHRHCVIFVAYLVSRPFGRGVRNPLARTLRLLCGPGIQPSRRVGSMTASFLARACLTAGLAGHRCWLVALLRGLFPDESLGARC